MLLLRHPISITELIYLILSPDYISSVMISLKELTPRVARAELRPFSC